MTTQAFKRTLLFHLLLFSLGGFAFAANRPGVPADLTVETIVARNVEARGGLEGWRKVQTMMWTGRLERARAEQPSLPFVLDQKRPNKTRFEIQMMATRTLRVFNGIEGWKSHSGAGNGSTLEPFSPEEAGFARGEQTIDGPLIDYAARGSSVTLAGVDQLEGHTAYRLDVRLRSGEHQFVWVAADSFLDVKVARVTFGPDKKPRMVPVFYRSFRSFDGLQIATMIDIGDPAEGQSDHMRIEKVTLNAPMPDHLFERHGERR